MDEEHISVVPNIPGQRNPRSALRRPQSSAANSESVFQASPAKTDPDVRKVLEMGSDDFNVHKMPHTKTKEETDAESTPDKAGTSSWVIIIMAIVVIILICAIVYLVLKYNEPPAVPNQTLISNLRRSPNVVKRVVIPRPPAATRDSQPRQHDQADETVSSQGKGAKSEMLEILQRAKQLPPLPSIAEDDADQPEQSAEESADQSADQSAKQPAERHTSQQADEEPPADTNDDKMLSDFYRQMEVSADDLDPTPDQTIKAVKNLL